MPVLIFLVVLIMAGVFAYSVGQAKQADSAWAEVAKKMRLRYHSSGKFGKRLLTGQLDGYDVSVSTSKTRRGNSNKTSTDYEMKFRKTRYNFKLTRAKALAGVAKFFGAQDIEIGEAEFDRGVLVKADRPKHIREFLTPERQQEVLRVLLSYPEAEITNGRIAMSEPGIVTSASHLETVLRRFLALAQILSRKPGFKPALSDEGTMADPEGLREMAEGLKREQELGRRLTEELLMVPPVVQRVERDEEGDIYVLPPVDAARVDGVEARAIESAAPVEEEAEDAVLDDDAAAVYAADEDRADDDTADEDEEQDGDDALATPETEMEVGSALVRETLPLTLGDADTEREEFHLETHGLDAEKPLAETLGSVTEAPAAVGAGLYHAMQNLLDRNKDTSHVTEHDERATDGRESGLSLDAHDVCEELFAGNPLGMNVTKAFDASYSGARVTWSGTLDRVDTYFSDYVFGQGPGAKATVVVHELDGAGYGGSACTAVVQLDEETGAAWRDRRGETFAFEGRLVKCEPYMRTLYVGK